MHVSCAKGGGEGCGLVLIWVGVLGVGGVVDARVHDGFACYVVEMLESATDGC